MDLKSITVEPGSNIVNGVSIIDRSSMMTYSKIVCCLCSAVIDANPRGTCEACFRKSLSIKTSIPTEFEVIVCKTCKRYLRPPYVKIEKETPEMMQLCLSRIKSYDKKVKIIDSNFIYTEPHSKLIKIKVTLEKEVEKNIITQNLIIDFKEKWLLCRDCQKMQTPHIWVSCVQIRQRVPHKKTMLYLEQIILHNKMQKNALDFKESNDGFDFFFTTRRAGEIFSNWIATIVPSKITYHKKYVSLSTSTFTYLVDVANVAKYDLFLLDKDSCTKLGGIGPLLVCTRLSSRTIFIDPRTFNYLYLDGNTFFKYKFKSFCNSNQLTEFLILDVYEEVDYKFGNININNNDNNKKKKNKKKKKNRKHKNESDSEDEDNNIINEDGSSVGGSSLMSVSTNYEKGTKDEDKINEEKEHINKCRKTFIKCIRHNQEKSTGEVLEFKSYLGDKIKAGEIYLGYDLQALNLNSENSAFLDENKNKLPDIILVRKKPEIDIKGKKLKRLKFSNENKKNKKKGEEEEKGEMKAFMEEIYEEKELKNNIVNENDEDNEEEINNKKEDEKIEDEKKEDNKEKEQKKENEKKENDN